ncbi:MAG: Gfo/Idh/MocA family oxidoreductase [Candidatus Aminicenantes bacterium]|nr:Gfo/Idh/MocA family oxidoreductase [Candidatus Aminicenantes bacterium]
MRVGVIGIGAMGSNHLRVLSQLPPWRLTCAVDIDAENLEKNSRPYDIARLSDPRRALDLVDVVAIAVPTIEHFALCRLFLENGKHVLVEKPISRTLEEADELVAAAERSGRLLAVGHLERFNPAVVHAGRLVERPLFIEVQRLGSFSPRSLDIDVIMDLMIHDLDIILSWDRSGVREIRASGVPIISSRIDIANVRLEFHSGLVANLTASRVSQEKTRKLRVFQKNLYISLDYKERRLKMFQLHDGRILQEFPEIEDVEPLAAMWRAFHQAVSGAGGTIVSGREGREALALALAISATVDGDRRA